jgi:hypothetical protein
MFINLFCSRFHLLYFKIEQCKIHQIISLRLTFILILVGKNYCRKQIIIVSVVLWIYCHTKREILKNTNWINNKVISLLSFFSLKKKKNSDKRDSKGTLFIECAFL